MVEPSPVTEPVAPSTGVVHVMPPSADERNW